MKKRLKKLVLLVAMLIIGATTAVVKAGIVAYWKLDEIRGGIASDDSGNGYNGILKGNPVWQDEGGMFNGALGFDGVDDHIDVPDFSITTNTISFVAWINGWKAADRAGIVFCRSSNTCGMHFGTDDRLYYTWNDSPKTWAWDGGPQIPRDQWVMVAVVIEPDKATTYVCSRADGLKQSTNNATHIVQTLDDLKLGWDAHGVGSRFAPPQERRFVGLMDEVAIFDHVLSVNEVRQLSAHGTTWFIAAPEIRELIDAVQKGEVMIKEQRFKEVIAFLEGKIAECVRCQEKNPGDPTKLDKIISQLRFQLAEAKKAIGASKSEIANTYRQAIEPGLLSSSEQGLALVWLHGNVGKDKYGDIIQTLLENNSNYLKGVVSQAKRMVHEQKAEAAVHFLELSLNAYDQWREKHPFANVVAEDRLPEIYLRLAEAREATGASREEIASAYSKTFVSSCLNYVPEQTTALVWLLENACVKECSEAIKRANKSNNVNANFNNVLANICKHLESKKDQTIFKLLLDTLFAEETYYFQRVKLMESCLSSETNWLTEQYHNYLSRKARLKFVRDCVIAEKYVDEEQFTKAAELYQDITNRCGSKENKRAFEFQFCRCLFQAGRYKEAASELEHFIANCKATGGSLAKKAILMKGRTHIQLSQPDKAIESFFGLIMEYPEMVEMPEITFLMGYCYMLQGNFTAATEAFECTIKGYPKSPYVIRARECIARIKTMAGEP